MRDRKGAYLLVCKHRPQRRTPVHGNLGLVCEATLEQPQKDPLKERARKFVRREESRHWRSHLCPAIVLRITGGNFSFPVIRKAEGLQRRVSGELTRDDHLALAWLAP